MANRPSANATGVRETYLAALRHGLVEWTDQPLLVGVVRRQRYGFRAHVDVNHPELAPDENLLDSFQRTRDELKLRGFCSTEAHNAAWDQTEFERRYRERLRHAEPSQQTLTALEKRVRWDEAVALVCYESDGKRCHRRILRDLLLRRLDR